MTKVKIDLSPVENTRIQHDINLNTGYRWSVELSPEQRPLPNSLKNKEVQSKLVDLSFNQKVQNIAGMQIADLVAYPIGRWVIDRTRENKPFEIIEQKFHRKPRSSTYLNYGLKVFP